MNTGILASYREKFVLLKEKVLTDEQFILYDYCVHQADFDETHKEKFGTFQLTNNELAEGLGWSEDKVGRGMKLLFKYGLLKKTNRKVEVLDFYRFIPRNAFGRVKAGQEIAYMREIIAKMRFKIAELREQNANLRNNSPHLAMNNTPIADIVSSKVNPFIYRTIEDYSKIKEEGGYTMLTEDDMQWIDKNIKVQD